MMIRELGEQIERQIKADHSKWRRVRNRSSAAIGGVAVFLGFALGASSLQGVAAFGFAAALLLCTAVTLLLMARRSANAIRKQLTMLSALRGVARDAGADQHDVLFIDSLNKSLSSKDLRFIARGRGALL